MVKTHLKEIAVALNRMSWNFLGHIPPHDVPRFFRPKLRFPPLVQFLEFLRFLWKPGLGCTFAIWPSCTCGDLWCFRRGVAGSKVMMDGCYLWYLQRMQQKHGMFLFPLLQWLWGGSNTPKHLGCLKKNHKRFSNFGGVKSVYKSAMCLRWPQKWQTRVKNRVPSSV